MSFSQKISLTDLPKEIHMSDYERLKNDVKQNIFHLPFLKSCYTLGSVKNPGISDLDFLIVVKNDTPIGSIQSMRRSLSNLSYCREIVHL